VVLDFVLGNFSMDLACYLLEEEILELPSIEWGDQISDYYLQHALRNKEWLEVLLKHVLLKHGVPVNSPKYTQGTLLIHALLAPDTAEGVVQFLRASGGTLDPIFPRSTGLSDSFVGEAVHLAIMREQIDRLKNLLMNGVQFSKPVKDPSMVVTLIEFKLWEWGRLFRVVCNAFAHCAISMIFALGRRLPNEMITALIGFGADINALDCVIGMNSLEYCTALDLWTTVLEGLKDHRPPIYPYLTSRIKLLAQHGGKILPREPVPPRVWRHVSTFLDLRPCEY